jgi:hypothetical protein
MKRLTWRLSLMAAFAALIAFGPATMTRAAEEDGGGPGDRLARLEQRVNELTRRQDLLLRRLGVEPGPQDQMLRQPPGQPTPNGPMPQPGPGALRRPLPARGPMVQAAVQTLQHLHGLVKLCLLVVIVFNILLAIWIYSDIRKRGEGSGIFIALALLAGIPAAVIYTLARIGERKT